MVNLILVVISIALMAAVAAATVSHVSIDSAIRAQMQKDAYQGVIALDASVFRYFDSNRDPEGHVIYPGDGVDLKPVIAPVYGFIPADVRKELTWAVGTGGYQGLPATAICLYPLDAATDNQKFVLEKVRAQLPVGSAFVGAGCGAQANQAGGTHLTYWMPLSHMN